MLERAHVAPIHRRRAESGKDFPAAPPAPAPRQPVPRKGRRIQGGGSRDSSMPVEGVAAASMRLSAQAACRVLLVKPQQSIYAGYPLACRCLMGQCAVLGMLLHRLCSKA